MTAVFREREEEEEVGKRGEKFGRKKCMCGWFFLYCSVLY